MFQSKPNSTPIYLLPSQSQWLHVETAELLNVQRKLRIFIKAVYGPTTSL